MKYLLILVMLGGCATAGKNLPTHTCTDEQLESVERRMTLCSRSGYNTAGCFSNAISSTCSR